MYILYLYWKKLFNINQSINTCQEMRTKCFTRGRSVFCSIISGFLIPGLRDGSEGTEERLVHLLSGLDVLPAFFADRLPAYSASRIAAALAEITIRTGIFFEDGFFRAGVIIHAEV
jgi:hypothetical protein